MRDCRINMVARLILLSALFTKIALAEGQQDDQRLDVRRLLIDAGLPSWLLNLNAEITLEAQEINLKQTLIRDIKIPISIDAEHVEIEQAKFNIFEGTASVSLSATKHLDKINGTIGADHVVFTPKARASLTPNSTSHPQLFTPRDLIPSWLPLVNGSVTVKATNTRIDVFEFTAIEGRLLLSKEELNASAVARTGGANLNGNLLHKYATAATRLSARGENTPLDLLEETREYISDVPVDFEFVLNGRGRSARSFVETMDGEIFATSAQGTLNIDKLDKLSQDILSLTLTSIVPISLSSKNPRLECAALKFAIRNGVAERDNAIALRTENLAIMGGGKIDFAAENIALALHPHARGIGKLNTKSAIKQVTLRGPFRDIEVHAQLGGIITQGISLTTKIATLGLSKLRLPLLDWAAPADVACMESLSVH